jgi:hypothetical protein
MERKAKVSFEFTVLNPTQKGMFGDNVIAEMTANSTVFPTPDVSLVELTAINDALKLKTQQALSGDKVKIQEREVAEREWDDTFRKEAYYVQRVANGSKLIIVQSGFNATDTEVAPVAEPGQAQIDAWANRGRGSGIHVEMAPLNDCRGYVFLIGTQPINNYASVKGDLLKISDSSAVGDIKLTTKRKVDFDDLESGKLYYISALGFNATGAGELANTVEVIAP